MADQRAKLLARKAELEQGINEAPGWGAAVGVMYEELCGVNRALDALPVPTPARKRGRKYDESVEQPADPYPLIPPETVSEE